MDSSSGVLVGNDGAVVTRFNPSSAPWVRSGRRCSYRRHRFGVVRRAWDDATQPLDGCSHLNRCNGHGECVIDGHCSVTSDGPVTIAAKWTRIGRNLWTIVAVRRHVGRRPPRMLRARHSVQTRRTMNIIRTQGRSLSHLSDFHSFVWVDEVLGFMGYDSRMYPCANNHEL